MIITGKATIWGLNGTIAYTGIATTDNIVTGADETDTATVDEFKDGAGEVIGLAIRNRQREITIDFYPVGTNLAGSTAAFKLPPNPSLVTLDGFPETAGTDSVGMSSGAAGADPQWIYKGGGKRKLTQDGQAVMSLPLTAYLDAATPSALATAVS